MDRRRAALNTRRIDCMDRKKWSNITNGLKVMLKRTESEKAMGERLSMREEAKGRTRSAAKVSFPDGADLEVVKIFYKRKPKKKNKDGKKKDNSDSPQQPTTHPLDQAGRPETKRRCGRQPRTGL